MPEYRRYYELESSLQQEAQLIPSPVLYDFDDERIYAAILNRLAQPLPDGSPSPFSAQNPGTAPALLVSNLVYLQSLLAHEFNLIPDAALLEWLRLLGTRLRVAEYPIVGMRFTRSQVAVNQGIAVDIPLNLEVRSAYTIGLSVYTITEGRIEVGDSLVLPARLSQIGSLPVIRAQEFSKLPQSLSFLESATNESIISTGKPEESLKDAVTRTRDWLKTGDRCVTDRDYHYFAIQAGASKVNVIRGVSPNTSGFHRDLRSIAVYPGTITSVVEAALKPRRMRDERLQAVEAEVIPVDGLVQVKALPNLSTQEVWNLAAAAIANNLNPPHGTWGDREFDKSVAEALELVKGIYAVPLVELKHSITNQPFSELEIQPWHLLEIQQSTQIEVLR